MRYAKDRIDPKTGRRVGWTAPTTDEARAKADQKDIDRKIKLLQRAQKALSARDHLLDYVRFTMPDPADPGDVDKSRYDAQPFHVKIAEALEALERGDFTQLIFVMPPRHGKSQLATKHLTAWYSGRHPDHDIAVASYSDTMAEDMGADTRAILTSPQHRLTFPKYQLRRGGTSKSNIQTTDGGRLVFVGRGGALTGRGMHLGIGDDLFKDHEEARSQAIRDQAWNWFTKVFMTRRMGPKLVILTFTRWHPDDIIGRLTDPENQHYNETEAEKWKIIRLPALAEDADDPMGRAEGEPLWPDRYGLDFLESQRRLDPFGFSALYQQRPTAAEGTLFKRENVRFYERSGLPSELRYYAASDHAVGTNQRNDRTCLLKVGVDQNDDIYLLDCVWDRLPSDRAVESILEMARSRPPIYWWAERGHISKSIGPFLNRRMLETGVYVNMVEVTPATDKQQRAQAIAARFSMGKVFLPKDAPWTERALSEMLAFPNGTHDDFVDALAYIGLGLGSQFGPRTAERKSHPVEGTLGWLKDNDRRITERRLASRIGGF